MSNDAPIAIFDSGLGGLTVVRQVADVLPGENVVYLGDTARVPYGPKSPDTVQRFAEECATFLLQYAPKLLIIACNTASATALPHLKSRFSLPILGVVLPGCWAAAKATRNGRVGVIATEATVRSGAYRLGIEQVAPGTEVFGRACPLLVPIVEEGRDGDDPITQAVLREYLAPVRQRGVDTLVLGCTHYPLLEAAVAREMGPGVTIVDSAIETARLARTLLEEDGLLRADNADVHHRFFATDNAARFAVVGRRFLGDTIADVHQVAPEELVLTG